MKLTHIISAGVVVMAGGMSIAWVFSDREAEAGISSEQARGTAEVKPDSRLTPSMLAARATFDAFWRRVSNDKTGLDAISIKIGIPHENGMEHLWMTGCVSEDAQVFDCVLSNEPRFVQQAFGSRYRFSRESISDWMYRQNGKIHGGYSIREELPLLPQDQADALSAMLAPLPQ